MLIQMRNEGESEIYLKMNEEYYQQYKETVLALTRGDMINFNATVLYEGNIGKPPVLESFGLIKEEEHIKISPHIHDNGNFS